MANFHECFGFNMTSTKLRCLTHRWHRHRKRLNAPVYIERVLKAKPQVLIDINNIRDECALQSSMVSACYARATLPMPGIGQDTLFEGPNEAAKNPSVETDR